MVVFSPALLTDEATSNLASPFMKYRNLNRVDLIKRRLALFIYISFGIRRLLLIKKSSSLEMKTLQQWLPFLFKLEFSDAKTIEVTVEREFT